MIRYIIVSIISGILFGVLDGVINANPRSRRRIEFKNKKFTNKEAGLMATYIFPFGRVQEAFETVFGYRDGVIKAMISVP